MRYHPQIHAAPFYEHERGDGPCLRELRRRHRHSRDPKRLVWPEMPPVGGQGLRADVRVGIVGDGNRWTSNPEAAREF